MPHTTRWSLAALSMTMAMTSLDMSSANAALPAIARAFGAPFQSVRWVVLSYLLALTASTVVAGRTGDLLGRRRLLLAGIATFTAGSVASSLSPSLSLLLIARTVQGIGAGAMTALAVALVNDVVAPSGTGRAMGLLATMSAVGTTLGPAIGGLLTARLAWASVFVVNVPIAAAAFGLAWRYVPSSSRGPGASVGIGGTLLRMPGVRASLAANGLVATVMMSTLIAGPFHLTGALGLSDAAAGLALSVGPFVAALSGVPAGRFIDYVGAARAKDIGLFGIGAAALTIGVVPATLGPAAYLIPLGVMTSAYAVFQTANNTELMAAAEARLRGTAAGMLGLSRNLGLIAGASLMGWLFAVAGVHRTFQFATLLIGLALLHRLPRTYAGAAPVIRAPRTPAPSPDRQSP